VFREGGGVDSKTFAYLTQYGVTNGAIYALLALALVMIFSVTRVLFIPQGQFVTYGALTMAALQSGKIPGTLGVLLGLGVLVLALDAVDAFRSTQYRWLLRSATWNLGYPVAAASMVALLHLQGSSQLVQAALTLIVVAPLGPMLYRVAYRPIIETSILNLLMASIALDLVLTGLGLLAFGPEASRTAPISDNVLTIGSFDIDYQVIWVTICSVVVLIGLYGFFSFTLLGKALTATALNRRGARLMGIPINLAAQSVFLAGACLGIISGILICPIIPILYDTGFVIGLKGFVAAVLGGLVSLPLAVGGAVVLGLVESFASYWSSDYKDVLVFAVIIPGLLWLSTRHRQSLDEDR
jgi:branched-subunit amino acid ABC-type transport system permease component